MTAATVTAADFDYMDADYARMCLMPALRDEMVAFFATDAELEAMIAETYGYSAWNSAEGKFEVNDYWANEARFAMLVRVQEQREDRARLDAELAAGRAAVAAGPLSYSPFAALAVA